MVVVGLSQGLEEGSPFSRAGIGVLQGHTRLLCLSHGDKWFEELKTHGRTLQGLLGLSQTGTQLLPWVKMDFTLGMHMSGLLRPQRDLL